MKRLLPSLAAVLLAASCTRTVFVPLQSSSQTLAAASAARRDSIVIADTVRITCRGDTVFQTSVRTVDRVRVSTDTVLIARTDTVAVPVEVPVPAGRSAAGSIAMAAAVLAAAVLLIRFLLK